MSDTAQVRPVLVAVDGSESAARAIAWAAREAKARRAPLTIMHTYHWPSSGLGAMEAVGFLMDALAEDSAEIVAAAGAAATEAAPGVEVTTVSELGAAVPAIVAASKDAQLTVIGSRGLGGFTGLLLGSVSTGVVAAAQSPVVVLRGEDEPAADAPVLAGVDGDDATEAVLREAFAAADRARAPLLVLHAWTPPPAVVLTEAAIAAAQAQDAWHASIADDLAGRVAAVAADFPDVKVQTMTASGRPAVALLEQAKGARLVVVGSRGRGEFKSMLLGSTSRALTQHAPCPVLVVH